MIKKIRLYFINRKLKKLKIKTYKIQDRIIKLKTCSYVKRHMQYTDRHDELQHYYVLLKMYNEEVNECI